MRKSIRSIVAGVAVTLLGCAVVGVSTDAQAAPPTTSGVDDWNCRPSAEHPRPVVFLHGFLGNGDSNGLYLNRYLADHGYCAFSLTYGATSPLGNILGGIGDIPRSAEEIATFIHRVVTTTGADKVDVVGHSLGGFMSLYVPKQTGAVREIDRVVAVGPVTRSTDARGLVTVATELGLDELAGPSIFAVCPGCTQIQPGGEAITQLNSGPIAQPGVTYTIITSLYDEAATPTENSFVREPGVTNMYIQDFCPANPVGHVGEAFDPTVAQLVDNALDPTTAKPVSCGIGLPL